MRIALISLARRGGMVHFHAELTNSLQIILPETIAITSQDVSSSYFSPKILQLSVNMGQGAIGTFINSINPVAWYRLYKLLQRCQADAFHIVASHEWNPILVLLIKMLRKPLVFTVHDPIHHLGAPFYMKASDEILIRNSNAMIVLSELGKAQLYSKGVAGEKIFHIPHGVYSFFTQLNSTNAKQQKMILFFGRIEPYKGLDVLLKAFSQAAGELPEWKLVIAGSGDVLPYASDLLHPQIEVINAFIPDEQVAALMQLSSMVVLPYIEATQSGVIPIAYAFARPVIATDVGSLKEMVLHGQTGLLIPPGDVDKLAQAIKVLATDAPWRKQLGHFAFEWSNRELGWERIARMHSDVYSKITEGSAN